MPPSSSHKRSFLCAAYIPATIPTTEDVGRGAILLLALAAAAIPLSISVLALRRRYQPKVYCINHL
jgi:hypothetical protein